MTEVAREVSRDYHEKLGQLILLLISHPDIDFVRMSREQSVITNELISLRATKIRNNVSHNVWEVFTRPMIEHVADIKVVADAFVNKMRKELGK